jgi:CheY-like chemotaxis protein
MAKILLVDEDPLQAYQRKSLLEQRFTDVERVAGAAEALCLVELPHFAEKLGLVISGHHMPGIGGPVFVAELRSRLPKLPVLVLGSGNDAAGDYPGEKVRYLAKPIGAEDILSNAEFLLKQS